MTRLLIALTLAVLLSCFEFGWRVELPPLPNVAPQLHAAAPSPVSDNCELDSTIGMLEVYYCDSAFGPDYYANSFGFLVLVE